MLERRTDATNRLALAALLLLPALGRAADTPAHPPAVAIEVTPKALSVDGPRDARRVIVAGIAADGTRFDLSGEATYATGDGVAVDKDGFVHASRDGGHVVKVAAAGKVVDLPVAVRNAKAPTPVSFVRDVMPALSRLGCNAGTCHGSAKGKKGFKLSLRGYDLDYDYSQLVDDLAGRRFNRSAPEQSLMLLKPTTGVPHEGGHVLDVDSARYGLLRDWIAEGVPSDVGTTARVSSLEVLPPSIDLAKEGHEQQLLVLAHYPDGSTRDVSLDAIYSSSVPDTATVTDAGKVVGRPPGRGRDPRPV